MKLSPFEIDDAVKAPPLFINLGSVWDIQIHLKASAHIYSIKQLMAEIERETAKQNRSTVIKLIRASINKMQKAIGNFKVVKEDIV